MDHTLNISNENLYPEVKERPLMILGKRVGKSLKNTTPHGEILAGDIPWKKE